jgi:hypothetical protein
MNTEFNLIIWIAQFVGILLETKCGPELTELVLYSLEMEFVQKLLHEKKNNSL